MNIFIPVILAVMLPEGLSVDDKVGIGDQLEFLGISRPAEATIGGTLPIDMYFRVEGELDRNISNFLHLESQESACRIVHDRRPTEYRDGYLIHHIEVRIPESEDCTPQRLDIFTGFFNTETWERLEVQRPTADDRVYAGWVDLVVGEASATPESLSPGDVSRSETTRLVRPFRFWGLGIALSVLMLIGLGLLRRRAKWAPEKPTIQRRGLIWLSLLPVLILLMLSLLVAIDFIKDDAYISFRYSHNLAVGDGLVFNVGDRLEGFTNFLWVLLLTPFEALGLDLFQVTEVLGSALAIGVIGLAMLMTVHLAGGWRGLSHLWAAVWLATSSSLARWATSGLEQPLAMFLPLASAYLLWRVESKARDKGALLSGVLMGLGCMTRPEVHLIGILLGLPLVIRVVWTRRLDRTTVLWVAGLLAVTVPFHLFRYAYFGSLVPNTFFVKTGASALVMITGLRKLFEMLEFNHLGVLLILAPLAFINRRHLVPKLVMLFISLGFMSYIVKVGYDEMSWHRLFLPALPFLVILAGLGLNNLVRTIGRLLKRPAATVALLVVAWAGVGWTGYENFSFTSSEMAGFNGRGDLAGTYHPDLGKFITRHERPGGLVAFQDMGSTPYHAPDIDFLDFIGLVDGTVARARYNYGLNAFVTTEAHRNQTTYNAEMREYFYERSPEWTILTTYIPISVAGDIHERFATNPDPVSLEPYIAQNHYQFEIYDRTFRTQYVHVRTWPRSRTYYLSLFRRADLWEQIPGEVILDELPEGIGGIQAEFSSGLQLLGSEIDTEAATRHEIFVTTWWELPGPQVSDLLFFLHLERPDYRAPFEHVPGDNMYPADRWRPGDLMENRYLLQLPPFLEPGEYELYLGVYRRVTGERLEIVAGPNDGQNRLHLGSITVRAQRPFLDHLIPPTDLEAQRRHSERIIDSGRPPRD